MFAFPDTGIVGLHLKIHQTHPFGQAACSPTKLRHQGWEGCLGDHARVYRSFYAVYTHQNSPTSKNGQRHPQISTISLPFSIKPFKTLATCSSNDNLHPICASPAKSLPSAVGPSKLQLAALAAPLGGNGGRTGAQLAQGPVVKLS